MINHLPHLLSFRLGFNSHVQFSFIACNSNIYYSYIFHAFMTIGVYWNLIISEIATAPLFIFVLLCIMYSIAGRMHSKFIYSLPSSGRGASVRYRFSLFYTFIYMRREFNSIIPLIYFAVRTCPHTRHTRVASCTREKNNRSALSSAAR